MKRVKVGFAVFVAGLIAAGPASADGEFSFTFEWGDIRLCNSGRPNLVPNPIFTLQNVPEGATVIEFYMRDLNAPGYRHGGGEVQYTGEDVIQPGAFTYRSPCPPRGSHTYRWEAEVEDANGDELAEAEAERDYPE